MKDLSKIYRAAISEAYGLGCSITPKEEKKTQLVTWAKQHIKSFQKERERNDNEPNQCQTSC